MSDEDSWEAALDSGDLDRRIAALVMGESDEANDDCVDETDATPAAVDSRARESRSTPQHESPEVSSHSSEDSEASVTHKTSDNSLSMPVMSLLDLPHDTIAAVLSFLPARDACALALTCSALRSAVHSDSAFLSSRWSLRTSGSRNARSARARLAAIARSTAGLPMPPAQPILGNHRVRGPARQILIEAGIIPRPLPFPDPSASSHANLVSRLLLSAPDPGPPGRPTLLMGARGGSLLIWDVSSGMRPMGPPIELATRASGAVTCMSAGSASSVVVGMSTGAINVFDRSEAGVWTRTAPLGRVSALRATAMEHVGRAHVAIGFADGSVRVIATGSKARPGKARVQVLRGHPESVLALSGALSQAEAPAWPRTGGAAPERLLSADVGATVLMWDCERWACVGRWRISTPSDLSAKRSAVRKGTLLPGPVNSSGTSLAVSKVAGPLGHTEIHVLDPREKRGHLVGRAEGFAEAAGAGGGWGVCLGGGGVWRDWYEEAFCGVADIRFASKAPAVGCVMPGFRGAAASDISVDSGKIVAADTSSGTTPIGVFSHDGALLHALPPTPGDLLESLYGAAVAPLPRDLFLSLRGPAGLLVPETLSEGGGEGGGAGGGAATSQEGHGDALAGDTTSDATSDIASDAGVEEDAGGAVVEGGLEEGGAWGDGWAQGVEERGGDEGERGGVWGSFRRGWVAERLGLSTKEALESLVTPLSAACSWGPVIACGTAQGTVTLWDFDSAVRFDHLKAMGGAEDRRVSDRSDASSDGPGTAGKFWAT